MDHRTIKRNLPGFTDKQQTVELGRKLEKLVMCRSNGERPDPQLNEWLGCMPSRVREKLVEWDLIDPRRLAATKPLTEHVEDFHRFLLNKDNTGQHATQTQILKIIAICKYTYWSEMSGEEIYSVLAKMREGKHGISPQTFNYYLGAIKQFCTWMIRERRASESPVAHLQPLNARKDRRRVRRAFSVEELSWLLSTAPRQPAHGGMTGGDRTLLYRLAVETGLRASELQSLTCGSFNFDTHSPTVTVAAAYSKHRRDDVVPLRREMVALLQEYLRTKPPQSQCSI